MPLPATEIQAFAPPTVKDGELTQLVRVRGELHGLRAPTSVWCAAAHEILNACGEPRRGKRRGNLIERAAAGDVLTKPNGSL